MDWKPFDPSWDYDAAETPDEFLAYRPDAGVFAAAWHLPADGDEMVLFTYGGYDDISSDPPTHWMPFPAQPPTGDET